MSYNISNLKTDLQSILTGKDLSKITGIDSIIARAGRDVILDADPYEMVRDEQIGSPIYRDAYYYTAPSDLKGDGVIDIYKQGDQPDDVTFFKLRTAFDARRYKDDETFTVEKINGNSFLRINKQLFNSIILDRATDATDYSNVAEVSNIEIDRLQSIEGGSSVKFDLSNVGIATIACSFSPQDLSNMKEAAVFIWVYLPSASDFTNINLKIGNDDSNYYSSSTTSTYANTTLSNGWNLLKFNLIGTLTGTVDLTDIDYFSLTFTYSGAQSGVRLDVSTVSLGEMYRIKYYSKNIFKGVSSSIWTDVINNDGDFINLDTDSYNLLLYKAASYTIQSQHDFNYKPNDSESDRFEMQYRTLLAKYKRKYKSERLRQQVVYYPY